MSLFGDLNIGGRGLLVHQRGLSSVNKNLTNVGTKGYKREIPLFGDMPKNGINFLEAKRVYDQALHTRFLQTNQNASYYDSLDQELSKIEEVFNDINGSGFAGALDDFFNSMNDVITSPDNLAARNSFLSETQTLVGRIRTSYEELQNQKSANQVKIINMVQTLNDKLSSLAKINKELTYESTALDNGKFNTYLNQRDQILEEISSIIDTKVRFHENGVVDIFSAKGHTLLLKDKNFKVTAQTTPKSASISDGSNSYNYNYTDISVKINGVDLTSDFHKGKIGALIKSEEHLNEAIKRLNTFTYTFANTINDQHSNGYDLDGNSGENLFATDNGSTDIDASNIILNITDPRKVAAAANNTTIEADNENMKALLALKSNKESALDNQSFNEYYNSSIVSYLGSQKAHINNLAQDNQALKDSIVSKMEELSGVNIDEELINLQELQRGYQASARIITVTNELFDTVMGLVR